MMKAAQASLRTHLQKYILALGAIVLVTGGMVTFGLASSDDVLPAGASTAPTSPTALVCGNSALLTGPSTAPTGSVTVATGDNSNTNLSNPNTTYYFASGVHTLGSSEFGQIAPSSGDTYIGAPGAILNGEDENDFAFVGQAANVTIEYLTIENFTSPQDQGVVNHDSGVNWTVKNDTIEGTTLGAALMLGTGSVTTNDCLTHNGQYGFNGYSASGDSNVTVTNNEISFNDTAGYDNGGAGGDGCGCAGGGKFWATNGGTVTGNYVHDNADPGIWADTNNTGFNISNNYISHNGAEGIMYEISYNASITNNTLIDNGWQAGPQNPGFPTAAIYVSESGGDSRVTGAYSGQFNITGNVFTDNWGGVVLWENANRYCSDGSDDVCTLVAPSIYTVSSCKSHLAGATAKQSPDYFDNCRWKTQNVAVSQNTFNFNPANIGSQCTIPNDCGFNGLFSEYGSSNPYTGWVVPTNISNNQNNHFFNNTYNGPWTFDGFNQGDNVSSSQWTAGFVDGNGSGVTFNPQDAGSSFNGSVITSPTTTTTTTPPATTTTTTRPTTTTTTQPTTTTTTRPTTTTTTSTTTTTQPTTTTTTRPTTTTTTTTLPSSPGAPSVTLVSPNSGGTAGGTSVNITGTGFGGATGVLFGSISATSYTVNSATSITAIAPAQAGGSVAVTVVNGNGSSPQSSSDVYTYRYPVPVISSASPNVGASGTVVSITGSGFTGATTVSFGSQPASSFTVNSNTSLTATAPAGVAKSVVNLTVTGPGGTSNVTTTAVFTYGPVVTSVSPNSGSHLGGTTVNIKGAGFTGATTVSFGVNPVTSTITVNAAGTQITVSAPAHAAGAVDVTVTTPTATTNTTASDTFTYF